MAAENKPDIIDDLDKKERKNLIRLLIVVGVPVIGCFVVYDLLIDKYVTALFLSAMLIILLSPLFIPKHWITHPKKNIFWTNTFFIHSLLFTDYLWCIYWELREIFQDFPGFIFSLY